jgi:uncharacterized repeat protein (TIGR03803 family)
MQPQALVSLFRNIVLAGIASISITFVELPLFAQNVVAPTAVQAANESRFASRLTPPANRPAPRLKRQPKSPSGPDEFLLYDNGPINGNTDAWAFSGGAVVSDTYTVFIQDNPGAVGISFGAWLFPGDTLNSAEVSITSGPNGGTVYLDQTVNFTQSNCETNSIGFNVCTETAFFYGPYNGTFWVNLQNGSATNGDPVYWDENSGEGCSSEGCPSQAIASGIGTIPSESFSILGSCPPADGPATQAKAVPVVPSPTQNYQVIYNFTGGGDGRYPYSGLIVDAAGNLYGMTSGFPSLEGTVFKLSPTASGWRFTSLYSLPGSDSGEYGTLAFAPNGTLVGTAPAAGTNGDLFSLSPFSHVSPTTLGNWMYTLLHGFTGGDDGSSPSGSFVVDSSGNIYGTTQQWGANQRGTLYEFTNGSLQILHAFPAFPGDGKYPVGLVSGSDGLYGITVVGGSYGGGTLFTTAGGYQVLHNFTQYTEGNPMSLAADQAGNLYVTSSFSPGPCEPQQGRVFSLSAPDWTPSTLASFQGQFSSWLSTDALGNVYGAGDTGGPGYGTVFKLSCCWTYTDLHDFSGPPNDGSGPAAAPVVDAQGNIYGTTEGGGAYGFGTVWKISP